LLLVARGVPAADWISVGPDGGSIDRVGFEPGDASMLYATSFGGGLFKSTDGGATFAHSDNGPGAFELTLVTDPAHPGTLYTNSFDAIWKSTDGGATWSGSPTGLTYIVSLVLDPSNPQRLIAGGLGHVAISTDGGATWTVRGSFGSVQVFHIAIDPVTPSTIFVTSAGFFGALHRSTDGGTTFTQVLSLTDPEGVAVDPLNPTTVYAWGLESGIERSLDGGVTWSQEGEELDDPVSPDGLVIDTTDSSILYALTGTALFRSTDGGTSFSPFGGTRLRPGGLSHLARDPGNPDRFAAGSSDGVALSTDGGLTWTHHTSGFHLHYITALAAAPSDPTFLYAGSPIVGAFTSSDQGTTWTSHPLHGGAASVAVDPVDGATAYVTTSFFSPGNVLKTTDHGATWTALTAGLETISALSPVAIAPSMPTVLYVGAESLYGVADVFPTVFRSADAGLNWSPTGGPPNVLVFAVAVDPTNPDHVFAAAGPLVYRTFDAGADWGPAAVPIPF